MNEQAQKFRDFIDRVSRATGWSPTEIARRSGVAATTINRPLAEEDGTRSPTLRTITKIVQATGVPFEEGLPLVPAVGDKNTLPRRRDWSLAVGTPPYMERNEGASPLGALDLGLLPYDLPVYLLRSISPPSSGKIEGYAMQEDAVEFCRRPPGLGGARNAYATYAPSSALAKLDEGDVILVAPERPARPGDTVLLTVKGGATNPPVTYLGRLIGRDAEWVELGVDRPAPMRDRFAAATVVSLHKVLTTREIVGL